MAINRDEWLPIKRGGKEVSYFTRYKHDERKYKIEFRRDDGKRKIKIITIPVHIGKKDHIAQLEQELKKLKGIDNVEAGTLTASQYWERFKKFKGTAWGAKRHAVYSSFWRDYIAPVIGAKRIIDITSSDITKIVTSTSHLSQGTRKQNDEILIPLFKHALTVDRIITESPFLAGHRIKRDQMSEKKIVLNAGAKYQKIYQTIMEQFATDPMSRALFLFGFSGRRKSEVTGLTWEDIDNDTYVVRAVNNKVKRDQQYRLPPMVHDALMEWYAMHPTKSGYIFLTQKGTKMDDFNSRIDRIREKSGIPEFSFHWMRNLLVSAASAEGVESIHLSAILGHTDGATVRKYLTLQNTASGDVVADKMGGLIK